MVEAVFLPVILSFIVGVQSWMVTRIVDGIRFQSRTATTQKGIVSDVEELRGAVTRLDAKVDRRFDQLYKMLLNLSTQGPSSG